MKKLLLGSTALLGAIALSGAASAQQVTTRAPFTLSIGGSFSSYFGLNSGGDEALTTNKKTYDFLTETLLVFSASAKTDNGLTYGGQIRLPYSGGGVTQAGTSYDRAFLFVQGSFGRVDFGDVNSSRSLVGAVGFNAVGPAIGDGLGPDGGMAARLYNLTGGTFSTSTSVQGSPLYGNGGTSTRRTKINYTTPVFSGFQAGISYAPSPDSAGLSFDRTDTTTPSLTAAQGRAGYRDSIELGLKYTAKLSGVEITPSLGYLTASKQKTSNNLGFNDLSSLYVGLKGEYMGASLGVGYTNAFDSGLVKGQSNKDSLQGLTVAAAYVTGPWAVSAYYSWSEAEGSQLVAGNDKMSLFEIAGGYTLAPGMQLWTAVHNYEFTDGDASNLKRNGTIFLLGTTVAF
jgi:outer membrane protein OmpU